MGGDGIKNHMYLSARVHILQLIHEKEPSRYSYLDG